MEFVIILVTVALAGFAGGVIGSNRVHAVESRLRADVRAVEDRIHSAISDLKK